MYIRPRGFVFCPEEGYNIIAEASAFDEDFNKCFGLECENFRTKLIVVARSWSIVCVMVSVKRMITL